MNTPQAQLREQFDLRHGNDAITVNNVKYFSNGATREIGIIGAWREPPTDQDERNRLIEFYQSYNRKLWMRRS
jgi:hypothetical protein